MNQDFEWFKTQRARYAFRAGLVGFIFPILATVVSIITNGLPLNLPTILEVQRTQPTLWIVNTAPIFFWIFGYVVGSRTESYGSAHR